MKTFNRIAEAMSQLMASNDMLKGILKETVCLDDQVRFMLSREIMENKAVIEALEWVLKDG